MIGVRKKSKNQLNRENWKKNNWKNRIVKKNRLNRLKFWKNRPVRFGFGFISMKPKKTNRTQTQKKQKKPSQTGFCPKKLNRNRSVWTGFGFKKNQFGYFFFYKNQTKPKIITSSIWCKKLYTIKFIISKYDMIIKND
jgi:hypothetical protein